MALVSTVALELTAQGGHGDAARTIWVCVLLFCDKEALVVEALSEALRALAKRDAAPVGRFLAAHGSPSRRPSGARSPKMSGGATKAARPSSRPSR